MATIESHVQISVVDKNGNVNILFPITNGKDVRLDTTENEAIPAGVRNVQTLVDNLKDMAFEDGENVVRVGFTDEEFDPSKIVSSEIDDSTTSLASAWSSKKVTNSFIGYIRDVKINDLIDTPKTPVTFSVDGQNNTFGALCPESGYIWTVEYLPVTLSAKNSVAGGSEATYDVINARQKWTGYQFAANNEAPVIYSRIYCRGSWGPYTREN